MKSVGEAMAIGRTFKEALQKGLRSLEIKKYGLESALFKDLSKLKPGSLIPEELYAKLRVPNAERIFYIGDALRLGMSVEDIHKITMIDPWFLHNIKEIIELEKEIINTKGLLKDELLIKAKEFGFSDRQLGNLLGKAEEEIYQLRKERKINPSFKLVDTCAAEFRAHTPYFYSTYEQ
jgi:carbamoyl-phosphate synthase large subunit